MRSRLPGPRAFPLRALLVFAAQAHLGTLSVQAQGRPALPEVMDGHLALARAVVDGDRARGLVASMEPLFRLPGNSGFDATIDRVVAELEAAGYVPEGGGPGVMTYRIERRAMDAPTWEPVSAVLRLVGDDAPLLDFATNRNLIAINSYPTPAGGVEGELVDVGGGTPAEFEGRDVRGRIVFADMRVGRLFTEAVVKRGAAGVIAYGIPALNRPEEHRDVIAYSSIPRDEDARSWALQLTTAARDRIRAALERGPVRVRVEIDSRTFVADELTLVADVRGSGVPDERFVFSAHVQEAGANDNASGVAALAEVARVFAAGVRAGSFVPERSITMIWGDEIRSTRRYLEEHPDRTAGVLWGLSLDMVGADPDRTGGTFLIEKMPDPSAVWTRGEDRHTEWGGRPMSMDEVTPHYFNDFLLNRCLDQADESGWIVRTNPFEGGSDHVPFLRAGIPGLLMWHFTDVFYHTDGDRLVNISAETLRNAGVCASTSAMALTAADAPVAAFLVEEVERAALRRLDAELALGLRAIEEGASLSEEQKVLEAWISWYVGALETMENIEVGGGAAAVSARVDAAVDAAVDAVTSAGRDALTRLAASHRGS